MTLRCTLLAAILVAALASVCIGVLVLGPPLLEKIGSLLSS